MNDFKAYFFEFFNQDTKNIYAILEKSEQAAKEEISIRRRDVKNYSSITLANLRDAAIKRERVGETFLAKAIIMHGFLIYIKGNRKFISKCAIRPISLDKINCLIYDDNHYVEFTDGSTEFVYDSSMSQELQ